MNYLVVAYHTTDERYSKHAAEFITSLQALALPYDVTSMPPFKHWTEAVAHKSFFMQSMLIKHAGKDLLYIDVDAAVKVWPALFDDYPHDVGVYLRPYRELGSGTIYVKNNPEGRFIIDRWVEEQQRYPEKWDQKTLQNAIDLYGKNISIGALPRSYCCKFDEPLKPEEGPVVIEHYMASRKVPNRFYDHDLRRN